MSLSKQRIRDYLIVASYFTPAGLAVGGIQIGLALKAGLRGYAYYRNSPEYRRTRASYELIAGGAVMSVVFSPYLGLAMIAGGAGLLSTVKPTSIGGFRSSNTYGGGVPSNSAYEGMPKFFVLGRHRVAPAYVSAWTEQAGKKQKMKGILYCGSGGQHGINAIKDIRLNGQPIGHYEDVTVTTKLGTSTQTAVKGFDKAAFPVGVGAELRKSQSATYTTHTEIDEVAFAFAWPQGFFGTKQSGKTAGAMEKTGWLCKIEVKEEKADGAFPAGWTIVKRPANDPDWNGRSGGSQWQTFGKTRGVFRKILRVKFTTKKRRRFRVTALRGNTDSETRRATLERVEEIVNTDDAYEGSSLIYLEAIASGALSTGFPEVTALVEGWKVSKMQPKGGGDPDIAWTRNLAELMRAFMLDEDDGCGQWISTDDLADGSGESWRDFRDRCGSNAKGGTFPGPHGQPRHNLDLVVDTTQSAMDWLQHMLALGRSQMIEWGGKIQIVTDQAVASDRTMDARRQDFADFSDRPVLALPNGAPDIVERQIPFSDRVTHLRVGYYDEGNFYAQAWTKELVRSDWSSTDPIIRTEVSFPGLTRELEAIRMCRYMLNIARDRDALYEIGVGPGEQDIVPMDVVTLQSTEPSLTDVDMLVLSSTFDVTTGVGRLTGVLYDADVYDDTTDPARVVTLPEKQAKGFPSAKKFSKKKQWKRGANSVSFIIRNGTPK